MVAIHAGVGAADDGERGHDSGLLVHADIGLDLVGFHFGIEQRDERLQRAVGVPEPVVDVEGARVGVDLMIESAVVAAVFGDVDHALEAAIERGVEDFALRFCAAFDCDLTESFVPARAGCVFYGVEVPCGNFVAKILLCLLRADEGNAVAKIERLRVG